MDYFQGYEDAMRQARVTRAPGLFGYFVRAIISLLYSAFIYVPLLMLGYIVAESISILYSNDTYVKIALTLVNSYLIFAVIYLLKGILIGLRHQSRPLWLALFILAVLTTSGVQAIGAYMVLTEFFATREVANYQVWSSLGAVIVAALIYSHYQFLTNVAPRSVFWSYRLGFRSVKPVSHSGSESKPKSSMRYFDNAPMRISFKR